MYTCTLDEVTGKLQLFIITASFGRDVLGPQISADVSALDLSRGSLSIVGLAYGRWKLCSGLEARCPGAATLQSAALRSVRSRDVRGFLEYFWSQFAALSFALPNRICGAEQNQPIFIQNLCFLIRHSGLIEIRLGFMLHQGNFGFLSRTLRGNISIKDAVAEGGVEHDAWADRTKWKYKDRFGKEVRAELPWLTVDLVSLLREHPGRACDTHYL